MPAGTRPQGTHAWSIGQLPCGRNEGTPETQRLTQVPGDAAEPQLATDTPEPVTYSSGTQSEADGQVSCCSCACASVGSAALGRHRPCDAPAAVVQQEAKTYGIATGASQTAEEQTPVSAPVTGSKQGRHRSSAAQTSTTAADAFAAAGTHTDTQRPSAGVPGIGAQERGTYEAPAAMTGSGTQRPAPDDAVQGANVDRASAGTSRSGTQCAPPQAGAHDAKAEGSTPGGPEAPQVEPASNVAASDTLASSCVRVTGVDA